MKKILSIIIPTYNMEKYLRKCLSSLLIGDRLELIDVIVVNDGSKDSSLEIARGFEAEYPDVFNVVDKSNGNYGSCVNRGLKEARGKYVKILDADDSYDTAEFAKLVERLLELDVDLCLTDYVIVNEKGERTSSHKRGVMEEGTVYRAEDFLSRCLDDLIKMHEIVYRTQMLRDMNYSQTEGIAFTDTEWALLPLERVEKACYLQLSVYKYLVGREGQTVDPKRAASLHSQGMKTLFRQISVFSNMSELSAEKKQYMTQFLLCNIRYTYRTCLVTSYKYMSDDKLREFDENLKSASIELYSLMDNVTVQPSIPIFFVREWRKNKNRIPLSVRFYRTLVFPLLRMMGKS